MSTEEEQTQKISNDEQNPTDKHNNEPVLPAKPLDEQILPEKPTEGVIETEKNSDDNTGLSNESILNMTFNNIENGAVARTSETSLPDIVELKVNSFSDFLAMLPSFSGNEDGLMIEEFLDQIEEIGQFARWDNKHMILASKMKLTNEAANFSKFHPKIKHTKSWDEFKNELKNRFGKIGDGQNKILQFTQATQKHSESTRGFLSRLSGLAYRCFPTEEKVRESLLFNQALKGLNIPTRRFIMSLTPKTFNDIWQAALQEEKCLAFDRHNAEINVAATLSEVKKDSNADLVEIKKLLQMNMLESDKKILELQQQVQQLTMLVNNQQIPPPNQQPLYMQQQPQLTQQALPPQQQQQQYQQHNRNRPPIRCYECGKLGHISRVCRNKKPSQPAANLNSEGGN